MAIEDKPKAAPMPSPDALLDAACEWLAAHPRFTTALICAMPLIVGVMETPR